MKRFLINLSLIVISMLIIILSLNILVYNFVDPFRKVNVSQALSKFLYIKEHGAKYDTLFLGSSRVYRQIDVSYFDAMTGRKSFNAGANELLTPYLAGFLDRVLDLESTKNVNTIFFELTYLYAGHGEPNVEARFYNLNFLHELEIVLVRPHAFNTIGVNFLEACLYKYTRALRLLFYPDATEYIKSQIGKDGFLPYGKVAAVERIPSSIKYGRQSRIVKQGKTPEREELNFIERFKLILSPTAINPFYREYFEKVMKKVNERGIEIIFVMSPPIKPAADRGRYLMDKTMPVFDFSEKAMDKYPELYTKDSMENKWHLNANGAELYTKAFIEKYLDYVEGQ